MLATQTRLRLFCVVRSVTPQWWSRTGASQDAPVSNKAGKVNPVRFRHP
ncbi:hypothetical protein YV76_004460 [Salmonella enterica subsp. enterica]|nr:hypothetical protein [Salmonella enterica subsp. enterica]